MEDETKERLYDVTSSNLKLLLKIILKVLLKQKTTTNTKAEAKAKAKIEDSIYTRIKFECKECHKEFRNKTALITHSYCHNRK